VHQFLQAVHHFFGSALDALYAGRAALQHFFGSALRHWTQSVQDCATFCGPMASVAVAMQDTRQCFLKPTGY